MPSHNLRTEKTSGSTQDLFDAFGTELNGITGATDIFAVGAAGTILRRTANGWVSEPSGTTETLRSGVIVASGLKLVPVVVGDNGNILVRTPVNVK